MSSMRLGTSTIPASRALAPTFAARRTARGVQLNAPRRTYVRTAPVAASLDEAESARVQKVRQEVTLRVKQLGEANKPNDAVRELAEMARMGVQPDTIAATALVHACARNGKLDMAQSVFDELFGEMITPDAVSFVVLIRGYGSENPPRWGSIAGLLSVMTRDHQLPVTTEAYNAMLEICARTNDTERGIEIMDRMASDGCQADSLTLQAVGRRRALRSHCKKLFGN